MVSWKQAVRPAVFPAVMPVAGFRAETEDYVLRSGCPASGWHVVDALIQTLSGISNAWATANSLSPVDIWSNIEGLWLFNPAYNRGSGATVFALRGADMALQGDAWTWGTAFNGTNQYAQAPTTAAYTHAEGFSLIYAGTTSFTTSDAVMAALVPPTGHSGLVEDGFELNRQGTINVFRIQRFVGTTGLANTVARTTADDVETYIAGDMGLGGTARAVHENTQTVNTTYSDKNDINPAFVRVGAGQSNPTTVARYHAGRPRAAILIRGGGRSQAQLHNLGLILEAL